MARSSTEHGVGGVVEVDMAELVSVVGSGGCGTVVGKGHTQPLAVVNAGEVDWARFVTNGGETGASAVKGDSFTGCNQNFHTGLNRQVGRNNEVVVGWVDANRAVGEIPVGVSSDVSGNVGSLAFVGHDAVVGGTVRGAGGETVVVVVVRPERCDQTGASNGAAAVRQLWVMPGPNTTLNVGVAVVNEVHVALAADLHSVVGVVTVVGCAEVIKLEASGDVHVGVALVLVRRVVVPAVVGVWCTTGCAGQRCVGVGHFGQTKVKGFPAVTCSTGLDSVVVGCRLVAGVVVVTCRRGEQNAVTLLSGLVHVTNRPGVVGRAAVGIVFVFDFVGHVVEESLHGAHRPVGVVV